MEDNNKMSHFFLGLGLGVAVGLLLAPKTGPETRDLLLSKADQGKDYLLRRTDDLKDSASDLVEKGRTVILKQKDQLNAAVEAGRQAYRDALASSELSTETKPLG